MIIKTVYLDLFRGEQRWRSGESARLPPSVICWFSTLLREVFPLLKTNIFKFQFDPGMHLTDISERVLVNSLMLPG